MSAKLNLREIFRRPEADFWARLRRDASIDELTQYWLSMVDTYVDSLSGVVTVRLRAFRRDDALALGRAVVETSEALVNRISERARRDATAMAEKEVRRAFESVQKSLAELHEFRDKAGIIDPGQAMGEIGKLLLPLLTEKEKLESELFVATREMSEDAPTVQVLRKKLEAAEAHIKELKAKVTSEPGGAGQTVAASIAKFEELEIQRQLAERFYALPRRTSTARSCAPPAKTSTSACSFLLLARGITLSATLRLFLADFRCPHGGLGHRHHGHRLRRGPQALIGLKLVQKGLDSRKIPVPVWRSEIAREPSCLVARGRAAFGELSNCGQPARAVERGKERRAILLTSRNTGMSEQTTGAPTESASTSGMP